MDWTNFGIVATFLWALQLTAYFAWLAGFPSPPRAAEESRAWRRPSAARKVNAIVFLIFAMIATVEAQKSGPANSPPPRACAPRRTAPARTATVGEDDIMRGYVLESETVDDGFSFSMPSNAITVGTWHIHGAASPFGRTPCCELCRTIRRDRSGPPIRVFSHPPEQAVYGVWIMPGHGQYAGKVFST